MTPAQAAALGLIDKPRARTTRKTVGGPYWSRCVACGTTFTVRAAEDRHVDETHHCRFEIMET